MHYTIKKPLITEKNSLMAENGVYVFEVERKANKTEIKQAVEIIESLRTKIASPELRTSYFASQQGNYEFYIDLLMQLHKQNPSQGYDGRALHASERSRARGLLELLAEANANVRQGVSPQLLQREKEILQQLNSLEEQRILILREELTGVELADIEQQQEQTLQKYRNLQAEIRATSPGYAALK